MKDHRANTKHPNGLFTSKVKEHMHSQDHYFLTKNITILDKDTDWTTRGIRESIQIRALGPTINGDQGRHKLPQCYNNVIRDKLTPISKRMIQAPKDTAGQFRLPSHQTPDIMNTTGSSTPPPRQADTPQGNNTTQTMPTSTDRPLPQPQRKRRRSTHETDAQSPEAPLPQPKRQRPSTHHMTTRRRAPLPGVDTL